MNICIHINKIITNGYSNNIISIYNTKCINIIYIYKIKYMGKYIRIVITFKVTIRFYKVGLVIE